VIFFGVWVVENRFCFFFLFGLGKYDFIFFWVIRKCGFSGWVEVWLMGKYDLSPLGDCVFLSYEKMFLLWVSLKTF